MKKYGHKKVLSVYQNQACQRDHHCVLLHIPFQYILVVAVLWYPASMLHHRAEELMGCRDKRQKDSRKWQKEKINLVVLSDLHGLLSASSNPMQSADAQAWTHTVSLPLPCSWLCHATCAHTTGRYSLFLGLLERTGGGMSDGKGSWCLGREVLSGNFSTMTVSLCPPHGRGDCWSQANTGNCTGHVTLCVWWTNWHGNCLSTYCIHSDW